MAINPLLKTTGSILTIADATTLLPLYSARGITQTMKPRLGAKSQRVTVNGELVDLSLTRMQKYNSVISATDVRPPSRDDVWPGHTVNVACAYLLSYPTSGGSPHRTVLSGSSFVQGAFTFYRPVITFMIDECGGSFAEWEAGYQWSISMNEV
jgi:hypothetical protein